jgi:16S rRNA (uracil1498-N3)-methyltransferase
MQRLFISSPSLDGVTIVLSKDQYHHLANVCRYSDGDKVEVIIDHSIKKVVEISSLEKGLLTIKKTVSEETLNPLPEKVTIAQCLPKQDKMSDILRKCSELAALKFIPLRSKRSVIKIDSDSKERQKRDRWQKVVQSAAEQAHLSFVPEVTDIHTLTDISEWDSNNYTLKLCCWEESERPLKEVLEEVVPTPPSHKENEPSNKENEVSILMVIGPEGGLSPQEASLLEESGFVLCSLGKSILRVENAAFFTLAALRYHFS